MILLRRLKLSLVGCPVLRGTVLCRGHLLHWRWIDDGHRHGAVVCKAAPPFAVLLAVCAPVQAAMDHARVAWGILEMISLLEFLTENASICTTQPPGKHQTFSNKKRRSWINTVKYCCENCKRNPSFHKDSMANTRCRPRDILSKGFNIAPKQHARTEQSSATGLWVVGASEDPGGPGLVGGRLVALREDLAALVAPPALELWDVDGLVELAGADVLGGGVLVLGELDVARRVALLRHCELPAATTTDSKTGTARSEQIGRAHV